MRNKINYASLTLFSLVLLTACQASPAQTINNGRPRLDKPVEEVVPTLKYNNVGSASEFKLRSQTAKYLDKNNSSVEVILSNTTKASCDKQTPALTEADQQIRITLKSKDGKTALTKGDLAKNSSYEYSVSIIDSKGTTTISPEALQILKITDINAAILRGNFKIDQQSESGPKIQLEGEFFTAVCK